MDNVTSTRLGDIYVRREADIIKVRDRVRRLAREMNFDSTTQIKITTAVSEITRNIYEYAKSGAISCRRRTRRRCRTACDGARRRPRHRRSNFAHYLARQLPIRFRHGRGLSGTRKLMDEFDIQTAPHEGTRVTVVKWLPRANAVQVKNRVMELRAHFGTEENDSAIEALQQQNQDFVKILGELEEKREELEQVNRRLSESNRELNDANTKLRELSEMKEEFRFDDT
jgi:anti-sigma regulatory factor (Ser/Thr protein kinase)